MQKLIYYAFHKPFGYLSQFTDEGNKVGLSRILKVEHNVYPVGRLDSDSEGLLLLTNDKKVNQRLLLPNNKHARTYWVQVEGSITSGAISILEQPMEINLKKKKHITLPAKAKIIAPPSLPERISPIRKRQHIPTSWISLVIFEGKNRQVRKMTAKVGFPTLRLVRHSIEGINIDNLGSGEWKKIKRDDFYQKLKL